MEHWPGICIWCADATISEGDGFGGLVCARCVPALRAELMARLTSDRGLLRTMGSRGESPGEAPATPRIAPESQHL